MRCLNKQTTDKKSKAADSSNLPFGRGACMSSLLINELNRDLFKDILVCIY